MSVEAGPNIVYDGLVLYLDAANSRSYPGSGTAWNDLSGNNINFTLAGSLTYNAVDFTNFTESANYFEISNLAHTASLPIGNSNRTILALCKTPTAYAGLGYSHIFHYGEAVQDKAFGIAMVGSQLGTHPWVSSPVSTSTIPTNTNVFLGVSYTQATSLHRFFLNGNELSSSNATRAINTGTTVARVGSRISNPQESWQTSGRVSCIMVYSRVLSATEILQNFNALKGRYGL
jgi:hypothetical protein